MKKDIRGTNINNDISDLDSSVNQALQKSYKILKMQDMNLQQQPKNEIKAFSTRKPKSLTKHIKNTKNLFKKCCSENKRTFKSYNKANNETYETRKKPFQYN